MAQSIRPNVVRDPSPGYRANVAVCVADVQAGKVLGFQRCDHFSWQFPQGGIDHGETPAEAALRELYEETGIIADAVEVLQELKGWVHYDWPRKRQKEKHALGATNWKGQRQKWFLMKARSVSYVESCIDLSGLGGAQQEFAQFGWFHIEDMLPLCRDFKRGAYAHVIRVMQPLIAACQASGASPSMVSMQSPAQGLIMQSRLDETRAEHCGHARSAEACTAIDAVRQHTLGDLVAALVGAHGAVEVQQAISHVTATASELSAPIEPEHMHGSLDAGQGELFQPYTQLPQAELHEERKHEELVPSSGCSENNAAAHTPQHVADATVNSELHF
eukprot:jgi/Ulvmu1/8209/UM041_0018.1